MIKSDERFPFKYTFELLTLIIGFVIGSLTTCSSLVLESFSVTLFISIGEFVLEESPPPQPFNPIPNADRTAKLNPIFFNLIH